MQKINLPHALLSYQEKFWDTATASEIFKVLLAEIQWQHQPIKLFGKTHLQPRLTAWYGDFAYTYSGLTLQPQPWHPLLLQIRAAITQATGFEFNAVLLNQYRNGKDYMGWHADDEHGLGKNPVIASASFGATRRFLLRKNDDHSQKHEFNLSHGSLLVMAGETQSYYQHSIPKAMKVEGVRINLTFRKEG
jgi:alkylated DNA repair dioxygenase AlkB